ncbi:MAG TPA: [LysW]-aminoadipate kinase [Candidatus Baltobacteraceae bacterium]|nr:[LysW]-aminoadipate kinase [Candidatus Baltobacteraceae bacterium]
MLIVKLGGGAGTAIDPTIADCADLIRAGQRMVLVHGASGDTNTLAERLGKPPRFVTSVSGLESRYTDRETLEIFEMAYCGKNNKAIVEAFQRRGMNAVGLSGLDGRIFEGKRKDTLTILEGGKRKVLRGDYTGKVERVNAGLVTLLLDHGYLPVLCPPAASYDGEAVNVDGDTASAMLAAAIHAETFIMLSNVPGLLRDVADPTSLVAHIAGKALTEHMPLAQGRMKRKLMAAEIALQAGVRRVILAAANLVRPVTAALEGRGTVIS